MDIKTCIANVLIREAEAIAAVRVDDSYEAAVQALNACTGKVLTTGMGKAGHVARKFAATLCSTGTPAAYVHPGEAAHGDLGLIGPRDCIVAFSTSGKTNEIIEMLELGRHLGLETIIGITSHPDSRLRELADVILDMGVVEEPCPLGPDAVGQHRGHARHQRRSGVDADATQEDHPRRLRPSPPRRVPGPQSPYEQSVTPRLLRPSGAARV